MRRSERETERERRAKTKRTEHYRQCLPIIANAEKTLFYMCSSRLSSARLSSARLGSSGLGSFSFVLFRIDLRLVDDSCAMTEIDDCGAANGAGVGSRLC